MNKHEALETLKQYCVSEQWLEENATDEDLNGCDNARDYNEAVEIFEQAITQSESTEKELELYKEFVKQFNFEIVKENNSNDTEYWEEEYLDFGGATPNAIELFKTISKVGK